MKQLRLLPAAATCWLVCALGVSASPRVLVVVGAVAITTGAALLLGARRRGTSGLATAAVAVVAGAAAALSCAASLHVREVGLLPELATEGALATATGTVRTEPQPVGSRYGDGDRWRVVLAVHTVEGRGRTGDAAAQVAVLGDEQWRDVHPGAQVRVRGQLVPAAAGETVTALLVGAGPPAVLAGPGPVDRAVLGTRRALLDVCEALPPDARGLVPGVAVGDRSRLPDDLDQAMRDVSITHVTAVSGAHFAVIVLTVTAAAGAVRLPRAARAAAVAVVMSGFVLLVGPQPSVLRAAVMGSVGVLGMLLGRPSRAPAALGVAVVVLLVHDPWLARSFGFVLSVLATAAIALLAPPVAGALGTVLPRWLATVVAVPLAAQAACAPVLVLFQPGVSGWAVPANMLAAPALVPATVLGVLGAVTAPWCPELAGLLVRGASCATWWIATVARTAAALPGARMDWPTGPAAAVGLAVVTAAAIAAGLTLRRWSSFVRGLVATGAVVALVLGGLVGVGGRRISADWTVVVCDVGQGDALVVRSGPAAAVVVDVGPDGTAAHRCLRDLGVTRIDLLVLSHFHADHVGGLDAVLDDRAVHAALVGQAQYPRDQADRALGALADAEVPVHRAGADPAPGVVSSGQAGTVRWTVLSALPVPDAGHEPTSSQVNDASVVLLLEAAGLTILTTGDAEHAAGDQVARRLGPQFAVDVLKVAHHGSAEQSEPLLVTVRPAVAVISAGRDNPHGHPAPATVARYRDAGATVLSTHECGTVALRRASGARAGVAVRAACVSED